MAKFKPSEIGFDESYIPEPNSGCWLWEKSVNNNGYGLLQCGGYKGYAHRFSYQRFKGAIPGRMMVCHSCDLPCCVNPDHLWLGEQSDNMTDCKAKGRHASQNPATKYAKGERAGLAKLNWDSVRVIRSRAGTMSQRRLAAEFGVSKNTVKLVINHRTWKEADA